MAQFIVDRLSTTTYDLVSIVISVTSAQVATVCAELQELVTRIAMPVQCLELSCLRPSPEFLDNWRSSIGEEAFAHASTESAVTVSFITPSCSTQEEVSVSQDKIEAELTKSFKDIHGYHINRIGVVHLTVRSYFDALRKSAHEEAAANNPA